MAQASMKHDLAAMAVHKDIDPGQATVLSAIKATVKGGIGQGRGAEAGGHRDRHRHRDPGEVRFHRRPEDHRRREAAADHPHLSSAYAARLFDAAQAASATEQQLRDIAAERLQEIYFKDRGRRAGWLLVEFTAVEHIDL
jgi:hypothetical protein